MKKNVAYRLLSLAVLSFSVSAYAGGLSDEISNLKNDFAGDQYQVKKATDKLEWSGISDESLFDQIAQRLETTKTDVSKEGAELNANLATALGLSGLPKYDAALQQYEQDKSTKKLAKYARSARVKLTQFANYNPVISQNNQNAATEKDLERLRTLNMLKSSYPQLIERGARVTSERYQQDEELLHAAHQTLLGLYKTAKTSQETDAAAWLCKILGRSKKPEFTQTLLNIAADKSVAGNIVKYAKKATEAQ